VVWPIVRRFAMVYHRFCSSTVHPTYFWADSLVVRHLYCRCATGFFVAILVAVLIGCRGDTPTTQPTDVPQDELEAPDGPPWFEDITDKVGLNFVHDPGGDLDKYVMHQMLGSGCAIVDLDGDGRPDLVLLTHGGINSKSTNKLFRQKEDGTFEDVTAGSGLDFPGQNVGIAIGDVNNDGKPDIVINQVNGVKLLLNQGGMKFIDATVESGLHNSSWGSSAAFLDYDRDGWLDLVLVNYINYDPSWACHGITGEREYCAPATFPGTASKLFRNRTAEVPKDKRSRHALFEDVTVKSHIGDKPGPGLGVAVGDFDGDGWPDIFIANDGKPNHLWINKRNGTFAEEALSRGVARTVMGHAFAGMGIAVGDVDNDGLLDLYVTHLQGETNTLWKQGPRGQFHDVSAAWGLTTTRWRGTGFGTLMADFNNDGWIDVAIVNGGVVRATNANKRPGLSAHWEPYGERNQLLSNTGQGKFRDVSHNNPALCGYWTVARGLASGDIDGDGGYDLLVTGIGEKARLLRNIAPNRGHWVIVRAFDPSVNRDAIGAEIVARSSGVSRVRLIGSGDSYLSAGPLAAHFGLGTVGTIDEYEVLWPDGKRERFAGGAVDRTIELRKGEGLKP
jgi:enediyne biosynthesis protein E4